MIIIREILKEDTTISRSIAKNKDMIIKQNTTKITHMIINKNITRTIETIITRSTIKTMDMTNSRATIKTMTPKEIKNMKGIKRMMRRRLKVFNKKEEELR